MTYTESELKQIRPFGCMLVLILLTGLSVGIGVISHGCASASRCTYNEMEVGDSFVFKEPMYKMWVYNQETDWAWYCDYHHCTHRVTVRQGAITHISTW